jgi:hypothetical protein
LGAISDYAYSGNGMLNVIFKLDLQTQVQGAGLDVGLILGDSSWGSPVAAVPLPGGFWLLGSALAGWLGLSRRKNLS